MKTLRITVKGEGAAFEGAGEEGEFVRILRIIALAIQDGSFRGESVNVRDINGNTCGKWSLK